MDEAIVEALWTCLYRSDEVKAEVERRMAFGKTLDEAISDLVDEVINETALGMARNFEMN